MPAEPRWLTADELIRLNKKIVSATGEDHGVFPGGGIESAALSPKNVWHYERTDDVVRLAAALIRSVAASHHFHEGNKRTGTAAAVIFLERNGYSYPSTMHRQEELAQWVLQLVTGEIDEAKLVKLMRRHVFDP